MVSHWNFCSSFSASLARRRFGLKQKSSLSPHVELAEVLLLAGLKANASAEVKHWDERFFDIGAPSKSLLSSSSTRLGRFPSIGFTTFGDLNNFSWGFTSGWNRTAYLAAESTLLMNTDDIVLGELELSSVIVRSSRTFVSFDWLGCW